MRKSIVSSASAMRPTSGIEAQAATSLTTTETATARARFVAVTAPEAGLDDIDRAIVRELQEDGRRTFREIGRKLDLSERTIRTRVRRMQDDGVLRILAFADPYRVGDSVLAMVLIRVATGAHDRVVETLTEWPEVSYISSLLGRSDVYVQLVCRD